jgi:hypothetical protein
MSPPVRPFGAIDIVVVASVGTGVAPTALATTLTTIQAATVASHVGVVRAAGNPTGPATCATAAAHYDRTTSEMRGSFSRIRIG